MAQDLDQGEFAMTNCTKDWAEKRAEPLSALDHGSARDRPNPRLFRATFLSPMKR